VAILLSGMLDDGVSGLREVARHGGITMVQDPTSALAPSMPSSAMKDLAVHYCLNPPAMARTIIRVSSEPIPRSAPSSRVLIVEDERVAALSLEGELGNLGYDVIGSVGSGERPSPSSRRRRLTSS
jgi:two-component system chemotaxis response regulator CheB